MAPQNDALRREARALFFIKHFADYFEDSLIQSSWARAFNARQSVAATSQLTMVRLACAT
jgi:hypothetical protein